jgi:hypothetical protein
MGARRWMTPFILPAEIRIAVQSKSGGILDEITAR